MSYSLCDINLSGYRINKNNTHDSSEFHNHWSAGYYIYIIDEVYKFQLMVEEIVEERVGSYLWDRCVFYIYWNFLFNYKKL